MDKDIHTCIKEWLSRWLPLAVVMVLLAVVAVTLTVWPGGAVTAAGAPAEDDHDIDADWDGTEGIWLELLWEPPQGQEIILIEDLAEGIMKESLTTGTNDFNVSVRRDADGKWWEGDNVIVEYDDGSNTKNLLKEALNQEWELKMRIPAEVQEKLKDGYRVGVAAADAQAINLKGGANAEDIRQIINSSNGSIEGMPGDPQEAREFLHEHNKPLGKLPDPGSALTIEQLFDLQKSGGVLQYKLEDEYLYIKGYPKVRMREDFYYYNIIKDLPSIPLVQEYNGGSSHIMYSQRNQSEPVGITSTVVYNVDLLKEDLTPAQELALKEELKISKGAGYIHFQQIRRQDTDGYLRGHGAGEEPFWFLSWHDGLGKPYASDKMRIGYGDFAQGGSIGLWFWYPLELTFYLLPMEDVAVVDIDYGDLEPLSMGTATVMVANYGLSEQNPTVVFSVNGTVIGTEVVNLPPPKVYAEGENGQDDDGDNTAEVSFSFSTPEKGVLRMTAEINPEPRAFEEITYENNTLTVTAMIGSYKDLPYWALSRDIEFTLPAAVATFGSPPRGSWVGDASGTLNVQNNTAIRNIYRDFTADGEPGNPARIGIDGGSGDIVRRPVVTATLNRYDFYDDPLHRNYASNDDDPLLRIGRINTNGSVSQRYVYHYYCSSDHCGGHTRYGTVTRNFSDINFQKEYYANVYNGIPSGNGLFQRDRVYSSSSSSGRDDSKIFKIYAEKKREKGKFDLFWEGTHYPLGGYSTNPAIVMRYMCHMDVDGEEDWCYEVPGQYKRTFIGQSKGTVTWEIEESMEKMYRDDLAAAKARKTGSGNYKYAVFATDKLLQNDPNIDYPIKSGYYFNPVGVYKCTVHTKQYKDTPNETQEHKYLVEEARKAFVYENNLVYADSKGNQVMLGPITLGDKTRGLLEITKKEFSIDTDELETTLYRECAVGDVNPLIREVLEGWDKSGTVGSYTEYQYREYTDKRIWLVEETTEITFTLEAPNSQKLYTHVQMKNGDYGIRVKVNDIKFHFDNYQANPELKLDTFVLDGIKVSVRGSMYDDR